MTFSIRFLLCNLVVSILLGLILLFKRISRKHVTAGSQYHLWYIFVLALILPFIPHNLLDPNRFIAKLQQLFYTGSENIINAAAGNVSDPALTENPGLSDFSASLDSSAVFTFNRILNIIWIIGCAVTAMYFAYNIYKIYTLKKSVYRISAENEPELYRHYLSCMKELNIKRNVALYASCSVASPVCCGLIHPTVIIPQDMDILLSEEDVRFIFLHELQHYKHKDAVLNYLSCILQIIYWFNPFIWYGFRIMRKDREIACDHSVIRTVGKHQAGNYGYTLIRYAEKLHTNAFLSPLSRMGGEKAFIIQRIKEIADYQTETFSRKLRGVCVWLLAAVMVIASSPLLTAFALPSDSYDFSGADTEYIDLSSYFEGDEASFVLYNMTTDHFQIYNKDLSTRRVSPDSTFKIYSALFALEGGVISADSSAQTWDGTKYYFDSWNRDQTLSTAMPNSVNWYFQNLDRQTGYLTLCDFYKQISYGNCDLSAGIDNYWAESSLKISPVEQVILLSDLLKNSWGFDEQNIQAVKDALYVCDIASGKLYGKTGTGSSGGENISGWFVGFLENGRHVFCFAANIQNCRDASGSAAAEITMDILNDIINNL